MQIHAVCQTHAETLAEALQDLQLRAHTLDDYSHLAKEDRRLLDQFAYRYTRLQDDMGARLMPAVLKALGEDIGPMSAIDRFTRLEQLGWLGSADEWLAMRHVRNQFAHDYPDSATERFERLQAAALAARQLVAIQQQFTNKLGSISH
jgi:flavin-dependent dehydrogenase